MRKNVDLARKTDVNCASVVGIGNEYPMFTTLSLVRFALQMLPPGMREGCEHET